ncbi:MAG: Hsp20/alpha crystallin family protein [Lewinellaceae bacterium]|nr:Hsp20/alpha crystallin family protein [Lewinellaceae bacterium]
MDDFFSDKTDEFWSNNANMPAVNVTENKKAFKVDVAAPGYKKDDFKIEVKDGYLNISANMKEEKEDKDDEFTRREWKYASFNRYFTLPENINSDDIGAKYEDGVLKITIPKVVKPELEKSAKTVAVK